MLVTLPPLGNWEKKKKTKQNNEPYMILKRSIKVLKFEKINCVAKP